MSIEEELICYARSVRYDDLPPEVIIGAKKSIVDVMGVSAAGTGVTLVKDISNIVRE